MIVVSILMITYNHYNFIQQAIEGVLNQNCDFKFELIVASDCSKDGTDSVVLDIIASHPMGNLIKYNNHETNKGMQANFIWAAERCTGKYIALCEGDDYWIDSNKLQKQVDLLESNSKLIACHHWQNLLIRKDGKYVQANAPKEGHGYYPKSISTVQSIFQNNMRVKTRTLMFRNILDSSFFPNWFLIVPYGDVPLNFLLGKYGDFGFIDEIMASYRITETGVSKNGLEELGMKQYRVEHFKNWIIIWDLGDLHYKYQYHNEAAITINYYYQIIVENLPLKLNSMISLLIFNQKLRIITSRKKYKHSLWIVWLFLKKVITRVFFNAIKI